MTAKQVDQTPAPTGTLVPAEADDDVHVDPNSTEGHPSYQESGDSEIIPGDRLAAGEPANG